MYNWILFDADNTLFDFDRAEVNALRRALEKNGVPFKSGLHEQYHTINKACWEDFENGKISRDVLRLRRFELFFQKIGADIGPAVFARQYLEILGQSGFIIEGADDLLERLAANYRMALVTNGLKEVQRPRLARSGLQDYFDVVVVSDEIGYAKPGAEFFDYTFREMGDATSPEQTLIVGDNLNSDIRGGLEYGLHTCWYNPRQLSNISDVKPTYEIHSLQALLDILG